MDARAFIAGWCRRCHTGYVVLRPSAEDNGTCSKRCSRKLKFRADQQRKRRCPQPWKMAFKDEGVARAMAGAMQVRFGGRVDVYPCICHRWHMFSARRDSVLADQVEQWAARYLPHLVEEDADESPTET